MTFTIRPYLAEDRHAMVQVYRRAILEGAQAHYTLAQREAWAGAPEPDLTKPDRLLEQWCFVSIDEGRMTGFMSMDKAGYLDMAFVIPEVMGKGTAGALYDRVMAQAREAGLTRFTVRAAHQSNRFLARRGWTVDRFENFEAHGQVYGLSHMSLDDPA